LANKSQEEYIPLIRSK